MNFRNRVRSLFYRRVTPETFLDDLVAINKDIQDEQEGDSFFNRSRAIEGLRNIRAVLSSYGLNDKTGDVFSADVAYSIERVTAAAQSEVTKQVGFYGNSLDQRILAAMQLAEETMDLEGDLFAAVVSPIELSLMSRVWVTARDATMMQDINDVLRAWKVQKTICRAWQDMEYYSSFYLSHKWTDGVPMPVHWSPKRVAVNHPGGFFSQSFEYLPANPTSMDGEEAQLALEFFRSVTGTNWNEFGQSKQGAKLLPEFLTWEQFLKPGHKVYPYPWLAKAATPAYTRQIIEEMRLALVQGVMNQLWVFTIEEPRAGEVKRFKSVISANRAERVGYIIWRAGLKADIYSPNAIEQLLLPDAWWSATLDMFRRIGRPIRIVAGENPQRSGQSSNDAEIDTRILQNKAMGHRQVVAEDIVFDLLRQWSNQEGGNKKILDALSKGQIFVHMSPIQLFLGEDLDKIWGPMWTNGQASIRTIHAGMGIDTDFEIEMLKQEKSQGLDELFIARQQFAQRVATPQGEVTTSKEGGRPPDANRVKAAVDDITDKVLKSYDTIDKEEDPEKKKRHVLAFIALLTALIRAHMQGAYREGYEAGGGWQTTSGDSLEKAILWERAYIDKLQSDLLSLVENSLSVSGERYRAELHPLASWKRAYMDGVFQAKQEHGWRYWQRVLRPEASKTGPCEDCIADSKRWHPISEPFFDHPYGVCSMQMVRFMQTNSDGWDTVGRELVDVPLVY